MIVDAARVVTMPLFLPNERYDIEQRRTIYERLQERLDVIPGVSSSAFANVVPFAGAPLRHLSVDGRPALSGASLPLVSCVMIRGRYFEALGLRLLRGRTLTDRDALHGSLGAIVNQRLATTFFGQADPIGHQICLTATNARTPEAPLCPTIVGVAPTVRQQYLQEIDPVVYLPDRAEAAGLTLIVRGNASLNTLAPQIRAEVSALEADISSSAIMPLDRVMTQSRWGHRVFAGMLTAFALVGLLLSTIGLYAVTAFSVVQRTHEIGVRMALGARSADLVWLFIRRTSWPIGLGIAAGLGGAFSLGRLLQRFLIDTSPTEPTILAGIAVLLALVSFAAAFIPARRATRFDPLAALRYE